MTPPRIPKGLVWAVADPAERRYLLSDLQEEYDALSATRGRAAAYRWYWSQAVRSIVPSLTRRLRRRPRVTGRAWRGGDIPGSVIQDARYALRGFRRTPGFTAVALVTLMLGIGASTAIFTVVNAVLLRPLPFNDPEQLVTVSERKLQGDTPAPHVSPPNFADWREQNEPFSHMSVVSPTSFVLTGGERVERVSGMSVSPEFFPLIGVQVAHGRPFRSEEGDSDEERVVILSHGFWLRWFGGDLSALERTIALDDHEHRVVGVLPPGFKFQDGADLWTPFVIPPENRRDAMRGARYLDVLARIKPGVTFERAQQQMDALARRLEDRPNNAGWGIALLPLHEEMVEEYRRALLLIFGAVGFVMLIVCANVANLVLARSTRRLKERALRAALGASVFRLFRQLLTENVLLAVVGGGLGMVVAHWTIAPLVRLAPAAIPRLDEVRLDGAVFGFAMVVSLLTGLLFSLVPTLLASRSEPGSFLRVAGASTGRRRQRLRAALIVSEVALSMILLIGAGLMTRSFVRLRAVDPGFAFESIMTASLALPSSRYESPERQSAFYARLLDDLGSLAGVESVGATTNLPMSGSRMTFGYRIDSRSGEAAEEQLFAEYHATSTAYFRTMGIGFLSGRTFNAVENAGRTKAVIINQTLAQRRFPGSDPIGERLTVVSQGGPTSRQIVGVIADVKHAGPRSTAREEVYVPLGDDPWRFTTVVMDVRDGESNLRDAIQARLSAIDPALPLSSAQPMARLIAGWMAPLRFQMLLVGLFAVVALALAGVGIYGVIAYIVGTRTNEIGVRMALGADGDRVFRLFLGQGMMLAGLGAMLGLVGAFALTRFVRSLLFDVAPYDPLTFGGITATVLLVASVASYLPARRATRVDAVSALKTE
jgi:putative ABC transport system permease protein